MIKILIIEDQTILRDALENLIGEQPDMEIAGVSGDASKAPDLCRKLKPDLVLMDVMTENGTNGIQFAAEIRNALPDIKIIIMTGLPEITFIDEARKVGAHSYLYKNADKEHLFYVIRSTIKGIGLYPGPADLSPFAGKFTEKEIAVVRLVCRGETRSEMIENLEISEAQLKLIISSILDKTGFDNISQFAIYAVGRGLIVPDSPTSPS
jgi:DNA-binding NarL/FixJ family response regulator